MGVFFNLSCRNCKKQYYAPDFTEAQLTWVKYENMNPQYRVTSIIDGDTLVDTITTARKFIISEERTDHGKCDTQNAHYKTAIGIHDVSPYFSYNAKIESLLTEYRLSCSSLIYSPVAIGKDGLKNDPRKDTAIVNGHLYTDVYKTIRVDFFTTTTSYLSQRFGIVYSCEVYKDGTIYQSEIL
jgi:hypothetical protein